MRPFPAWPFVVLALAVPRVASAQCGANRTTCSACHDGARASLPTPAAWHRDHAFADLCATCHGGDGAASELGAAHAGLVAPLGDADARCGSCHGARAASYAARYRLPGDADAGVAPVARSVSSSPPRTATPPHGHPGANLVLGGAELLLGLAGIGFVASRERSRRRLESRVDTRTP